MVVCLIFIPFGISCISQITFELMQYAYAHHLFASFYFDIFNKPIVTSIIIAKSNFFVIAIRKSCAREDRIVLFSIWASRWLALTITLSRSLIC